mmetsp:Transcript_23414/g.55166  ORF Transcript_23414/g.55166 Transcript_23414/m.55166 type:complete len:803 (-) Transcript_23414:934-3342(-)
MDDPESSDEMTDITLILEDAASLLTFDSPMLHSKAFNLQDSMSALEIMDRKMDCCEVACKKEDTTICNESNASNASNESNDEGMKEKSTQEKAAARMIFPRPAPTGLDDEVDPLPWDDLTLEDAVFIATENLIRLESYLTEGSSVVESTFTCLYAHNSVMQDMKKRLEPFSLTEQMQAMMTAATKGTLPQHIVYSSTLMLIELTELCRAVIINADIYEEEDFAVSTYNIEIFGDREETSVVNSGRRVLEMIQKALSVKGQDGNISLDVLNAANWILGFQIDFIDVIGSMAGLSGAESIRHELETAQTTARAAVAKASKIPTVIGKLKKSQSETTKVVIKRSFDSNVNRPSVGNAPLRKIVFREPAESISSLQKIIGELDRIVCNILLKGNTLGRIQYMLINSSATSANILARSLVVLNLYFDEKIFGQYLLPDMIINHLKQLSGVPDDVFGTKGVPAFLNRLCKPVYDTLKVLALNKNRQRCYIDVMLGDWALLREEAYIVDVTHHQEIGAAQNLQPYFSLYVLCVTIDLMDKYVNLGVELKLHCNEEELGVAFWYRDFLTSSLLSQLTSMRQTKMQTQQLEAAEQLKKQQQSQQQSNSRSHKSGKKKGKNKKSNSSSISNKTSTPTAELTTTAEDIEDNFDFLMLNLKRSLCRGLVRFFAAIRQAGLISEKKYEFTSNQRIFEKRFELFSGIQQPPPLGYEDYISGSDFSKVPQSDLLTSTADSFRFSKSMIDRLLVQVPLIDPDYLPVELEELRQLTKVCIGNSIYLQRLMQMIKGNGESKARVTIDTETNGQFCTIKIE